MKLKTRKSALKRVNSKKYYFARKKSFKAHLLKQKNSKRLRRLSNNTKIHSSDLNQFYRMLPYN